MQVGHDERRFLRDMQRAFHGQRKPATSAIMHCVEDGSGRGRAGLSRAGSCVDSRFVLTHLRRRRVLPQAGAVLRLEERLAHRLTDEIVDILAEDVLGSRAGDRFLSDI